mgnify:CR=1 FL=1
MAFSSAELAQQLGCFGILNSPNPAAPVTHSLTHFFHFFHLCVTNMKDMWLCGIILASIVYKSLAFANTDSATAWRGTLNMKLTSGGDLGKKVAGAALSAALLTGGLPLPTLAASEAIKNVPVFAERRSDLQAYSDIGRGFKMQRPFGFNEFEGAGGGYLVKFASLFDVDENVVVGSAPASAGKTNIEDYGSLDALGEKLASKRNGKLLEAEARVTEGYTFYKYKFETPLDMNLPRTGPKDKRPDKGIELYELCVAKGRLWSVSATSNNILFPKSEAKLQASLYSFLPRL